ncbi:hypothetical protein Trco_002807 [Trichoderma cornu-damae]|uniref:Uncharacterized protein n=1 Tax=Trichoderma cornu-damae TaxID=654480 RepID=A0A9P8QND2_9HYPO|nr:hypothetical protein Trco_002807 [Trichoderma cornu-damae]
MSNHKTRPARSNSLQRMLELERRYMLERLQASQPNALLANSTSIAAVVPRLPHSSSSRPAVQSRRTEPSFQQDARKGAGVAREKMPVAQIVPLTINVGSTKLQLDFASDSDHDAQQGAVAAPESHSSPVDKPVLKAVSFDVPQSGDEDDRKSICQSPSWEAYGRRKKEEKKDHKKEQKREQQKKKEEERRVQERKDQLKREQLKKEQLKKEQLKKEQLEKEQQLRAAKREREESVLRNALIKKKRLSKQPPPTSSPYAMEQANRMVSAAALASSIDEQRPSSALELATPIKDDAHHHHARSGSFTTLIKAPFESRRASIDTVRPGETGFIGGIKLEIQRHAANQKTAEGPENMDESKIHPALRTNNAHNQKWSAPPARPIPESQRRAYPPITRHPAAAAKTRSLVLSAEADAPDLGTMEKWKAFVGLKTKDSAGPAKDAAQQQQQQQQSSKKPAMASEATSSASALPLLQATAGVGATVGVHPQAARGPGVPPPDLPTGGGRPTDGHGAKPKLSICTGDYQPHGSVAAAQMPAKEARIQADLAQIQPLRSKGSGPVKSGDIADQNLIYGSALMPTSLALAPPRRSSKRNSIVSLNGSISTVSSPSSHRPGSSDSTNCNHNHDLLAGKLKKPAENPSAVLPHAGTPTAATPRVRPPIPATDSAEPRDVELHSGGAPLRTSSPREAGRIARGQRPDPIEIPTWDDIQSSVMRVIDTKVSLSPIRKSHSFLRDDSDFTVRRLTDDSVPATSADDSSSDDFHSPSVPGTPDTSRPQSEKGLPPIAQDVDGKRAATEQRRARNGSQSPARQPLGLQPAAVSSQGALVMKNSRPAGNAAMSSSAIAAKTAGGVAGQAVQAMPRQHPQPAAPLPGPASYLEEARKAAPLAPPPQVLGSPRLCPKVTPPPSIRSQPSSTTDLVSTKAIRHTPGTLVGGEPIAKMFVECCGCKYYHDMPSSLYEAMANPEAMIRPRGNVGYAGALSMTVKCPWCSHEMSTKCCAGYAAMVYVKERLH